MNHDDFSDEDFPDEDEDSLPDKPSKRKVSSPPPSLIPPTVTIPEPIPLDIQHSATDTLKANIEAYNTMLKVTHTLWTQVNSFGKAMTLLNQVEKLIKLRAEIMGHPYGVSARSSGKGSVIYPDD